MATVSFFLETVLQTSIAQSCIIQLFLLVLTYILQLHLFVILSMLYRFNPITNFILDIVATLALHDILWTISWSITNKHKQQLVCLLKPVLNPIKKKKEMRSLALFILTMYLIFVVQIANIDKSFITLSLVHFIICHFIRQHVLSTQFRCFVYRKMQFLKFYCIPNTKVMLEASNNLIIPTNELYFSKPMTQSEPDLSCVSIKHGVANKPVSNVKGKLKKYVGKKLKRFFKFVSSEHN